MAVVLAAAGGAHLYLYTLRRQGDELRYDSRPLGRSKRIFLFNDQLKDNLLLTLGPGIAIGTAWESFLWWAYPNGVAGRLAWTDNPIASAALIAFIPFWAVVYFSIHHWLLHRRAVYRHVHAWHHRNVNIGPWSGLAMHPFEHLVLFSDVMLFLLVPSHPVHVLFLMLHHTIGAPLSHTGYDAVIFPGSSQVKLNVGDFHHQLHHRFIECNYGGYESPFDDLIGAFHDGTAEGERRTAARRKRLNVGRVRQGSAPRRVHQRVIRSQGRGVRLGPRVDQRPDLDDHVHPDGDTFTSWVRVVDRSGDSDSYVQTHERNTILPDGNHLRTLEPLRFRSEAEILNSLTKARFALDTSWGDWKRSPFTPESRELIVLARRLV